jgi:hypothetical protein
VLSLDFTAFADLDQSDAAQALMGGSATKQSSALFSFGRMRPRDCAAPTLFPTTAGRPRDQFDCDNTPRSSYWSCLGRC